MIVRSEEEVQWIRGSLREGFGFCDANYTPATDWIGLDAREFARRTLEIEGMDEGGIHDWHEKLTAEIAHVLRRRKEPPHA